MRFYTGIASVVLINNVLTLIEPYVTTYHVLERMEICHEGDKWQYL